MCSPFPGRFGISGVCVADDRLAAFGSAIAWRLDPGAQSCHDMCFGSTAVLAGVFSGIGLQRVFFSSGISLQWNCLQQVFSSNGIGFRWVFSPSGISFRWVLSFNGISSQWNWLSTVTFSQRGLVFGGISSQWGLAFNGCFLSAGLTSSGCFLHCLDDLAVWAWSWQMFLSKR